MAHRSGNIVIADAAAVDADGQTVAVQTVTYAVLDPRIHRPVEPERVLATLLFTDIVGSTPHAERMGDASWRSVLGEYQSLVRRELGIHRGREVKTIGDGFLARFESPASAIRAARGIRDGVKRLHLEVRSGVHTGECEEHAPIWRASLFTSPLASSRWHRRARSWYRRRCETLRPAQGLGSPRADGTSSRA